MKISHKQLENTRKAMRKFRDDIAISMKKETTEVYIPSEIWNEKTINEVKSMFHKNIKITPIL